MKSLSVAVVLGTRPEIIKLAPLIRQLGKKKIPFFIIHTGQHYSAVLDGVFFDELELPPARFRLEVGSGTHGAQTGAMLTRIEDVLLREKPTLVMVQGDTNSGLAGALAATKLAIPVVHVEAGLRSYFREMPEEINRILIDHMSDLLFVPTKGAAQIAIGEGVSKKRIMISGNTIVDAVKEESKRAHKKSQILKKLSLEKNSYILVTAHRPENVDSFEKLSGIIEGLALLAKKYEGSLVWPVHPRTLKNIENFELRARVSEIDTLTLVEPVGFWDFLSLESQAALVLTDSGGIQEEACILKVPCVTLRENTERPETVKVGANILVGTTPKKILAGALAMLGSRRSWKNPFGDGSAAEKIVSKILKTYN